VLSTVFRPSTQGLVDFARGALSEAEGRKPQAASRKPMRPRLVNTCQPRA
jgi:hypothetical protein